MNATLEYGEEYEALMKMRKELMKMKTILKKVCPPHEAMLRHKVTFKEKANPNNPKHVANLEKKLEKEKAKINLALMTVKKNIAECKLVIGDDKDLAEALDAV